MDPRFTAEEQVLLKRIARGIIPPAPALGLPGADDELIFNHALASTAEQATRLQGELNDLLTTEGGASRFVLSDEVRFDEWLSDWAKDWPGRTHTFFRLFVPILLRAYYQDPRVHSVYDRRPGPPFPEGYAVIEGDWSLLDSVRSRAPFYRR